MALAGTVGLNNFAAVHSLQERNPASGHILLACEHNFRSGCIMDDSLTLRIAMVVPVMKHSVCHAFLTYCAVRISGLRELGGKLMFFTK